MCVCTLCTCVHTCVLCVHVCAHTCACVHVCILCVCAHVHVFVHCVCARVYVYACVLAHRCTEDGGLLLAQDPVLREVLPAQVCAPCWLLAQCLEQTNAWLPPTEGAAPLLWPRPKRLRLSVLLRMACLPASSPVFPPVDEFALWRTLVKCVMREELDKEYQWGSQITIWKKTGKVF